MTDLISDSLLAELEESIPQGQPNSTRPEPDDGFGELDDLLAESVGQVEEKAQYEADLKARKRNFVGMSKEEVEFCNTRMQAFEQARIWRPKRNIAVFTLFACKGCLSEKRVFTRWMQEQVSRTNATARRFDTVAKQLAYLPTIVAEDRREVALCTSCAHEYELDTHNAQDLKEILK